MHEGNKKKDNAGFSLIELIVVTTIMAILTSILTPMLLRYIAQSRAAACASNRAAFVRYYAVYATEAGTDKTVPEFLSAAKTDGLPSEHICPGGGECTFDIEDGNVSVFCSVHEEDPEPSGSAPAPLGTTITLFRDDPAAGLVNAQILYIEAGKYLTELINRYPDFPGTSVITISGTSPGNVNVMVNGVRTPVAVAQELRALVNPNNEVFGDVKVYLSVDPATGKSTQVSYVAIKSGSTWAKYSPSAQVIGTASDAWVPAVPPG